MPSTFHQQLYSLLHYLSTWTTLSLTASSMLFIILKKFNILDITCASMDIRNMIPLGHSLGSFLLLFSYLAYSCILLSFIHLYVLVKANDVFFTSFFKYLTIISWLDGCLNSRSCLKTKPNVTLNFLLFAILKCITLLWENPLIIWHTSWWLVY